MVTAWDYLLSVAALIVTLGSLVLGATQLRRRLLAGWSGLPAWVADSVLALGLLIVTAELLGSAGLLRELPIVCASMAVGLGLRLGIRDSPRPGAAPPAPPQGRLGSWIGMGVVSLLLAHWSIRTGTALHTGMTGYDTAWYHMPFAAHFAQTGSTLGFDFVSPRYLTWFYPANSELLHGIGMVLFHRDFLSPLLNMVWLGGCLAAAWCIGRPYGAAPWTLVAVAVLLDSGVMADQAGGARNDSLGLFFLLAAAALLVNGATAQRDGQLPGGVLAVAGLATGLAAGTKLSFVAPALALVVALPLIAGVGRRPAVFARFGLPALAGCAFWFGRNLVTAGNPLPWIHSVGPLQLDGPSQALGGRPQFSVLHYLGDGSVWDHWYIPALAHRLGDLWPLILIVALAATAACLARGSPVLRALAAASLAAAAAYLVNGTSAEGLPGEPVGFASSLRHLAPALALGLALAPLVLGPLPGRWRRAAAVALLALLVTADASGEAWQWPYLAAAIAGAALAPGWVLVARTRRPTFRFAIPALLALAVAGGWIAQREYLSHRYRENGFRSKGLDAAYAWASAKRETRIATTVPMQYPLLGVDFSNHVRYIGRHLPDAGFVAIRSCRLWRGALDAGGYSYLVTTRAGLPCAAGRSPHGVSEFEPVLQRARVMVVRVRNRS